jgi:capsid assembly protease
MSSVLTSVYRAMVGNDGVAAPEKLKTGQILSSTQANAKFDQAAAAGKAAGLTEGAALERVRIAAILACTEATGRSELANHIAFKSAMTVTDAKALLASSPAEDMRATNKFFAAMDAIANPDIGANFATANMTEEQQAEALAAEIIAVAKTVR